MVNGIALIKTNKNQVISNLNVIEVSTTKTKAHGTIPITPTSAKHLQNL